MLTLFTKNRRIVQNAGISFAILGTTMHVLNVANVVTPPVSHTWSTVAIAGFFLTTSSQIGKSIMARMPAGLKRRRRRGGRAAAFTEGRGKDEDGGVALP
jgi:hypothetical protein